MYSNVDHMALCLAWKNLATVVFPYAVTVTQEIARPLTVEGGCGKGGFYSIFNLTLIKTELKSREVASLPLVMKGHGGQKKS